MKTGFKLTVAGWSVDSAADPRTELLELEAFAAIGSPTGYSRVVVYAPPAPKPGLLDQAIGAATSALGLGGASPSGPPAFSVDVRGQKVTFGDRISLDLTSGDKSGHIVDAEVRSIRSGFGETVIHARSGGHRMVTTRLNQVYQNQTAGQIAKDLASQAGATAGDVYDGSTYPYFVVHESRNVWAHARDLAARDSLDIYFDGENKLTLAKFAKTTADVTLYYGIDILDIELLAIEPSSEHVFVYGESSSSSTGSNTWQWLAKDMAPVRGETGKGAKLLGVSDGAVRTKDAAGALAASKLGAIQDASTLGRVRLLGNPSVKLGMAIEIKNSPKPELNGMFKVISVRHAYNKREGYVTVVGFSGKGGAEQAGSMLGALAGALGGAIGL